MSTLAIITQFKRVWKCCCRHSYRWCVRRLWWWERSGRQGWFQQSIIDLPENAAQLKSSHFTNLIIRSQEAIESHTVQSSGHVENHQRSDEQGQKLWHARSKYSRRRFQCNTPGYRMPAGGQRPFHFIGTAKMDLDGCIDTLHLHSLALM